MERKATRGGMRRRLTSTWVIGEVQFLFSHWLKRAERQVSSNLGSQLKRWGIIGSEWAALREMYRPGRTSSVGLAPVLGMTKGGASKLIDRLVKKGLARRKVGELDRRCRPVGLTRLAKRRVLDLLMLEDATREYRVLRWLARHLEALQVVGKRHRAGVRRVNRCQGFGLVT